MRDFGRRLVDTIRRFHRLKSAAKVTNVISSYIRGLKSALHTKIVPRGVRFVILDGEFYSLSSEELF